tara:strand:- start:117 stop:380 length:264 start_codon:yes stop_codon:yes gene_type:complete
MWLESSDNKELLDHLHVTDRLEIVNGLLDRSTLRTVELDRLIKVIVKNKIPFIDMKKHIMDLMDEREKFVYLKLRRTQIGMFNKMDS